MKRKFLLALRAPSEEFQSMIIDGKSCPLLDKGGELLEWAEHQINDPSAASALNVMVVLASVTHFITHLAFKEPDRSDQPQFLKHRDIPIHGDQIDGRLGFF